MDTNEPIVIETNKIILAKDSAGNIILTSTAKEQLEKVLNLKKLADDLLSFVENKLSIEMNKTNMKKIIAGDLVIVKTATGSKFGVKDINKLNPKFKKSVNYEIVDIEAITNYIEENGELPEGIVTKERGESIRITKRNEE